MDQESSRFIAVISHLSGDHRGTSRRVHGAVVRLIVGHDRTVRVTSDATGSPHVGAIEYGRPGAEFDVTGGAVRPRLFYCRAAPSSIPPSRRDP